MVKLKELLTEKETHEFINGWHWIPSATIDKYIIDLTVADLTKLSWLVIPTEYTDGLMPQCVLGSEALTILTNRAVKKNLSIF